MLFIDNPTVERLLPMAECIEAQDHAFRGLPTGESVHRPRIDLYMPAERSDAYYRWGTMEGASDALGVFAIRMKSDILYWPRDEHGFWKEEKYCIEPGTYCGLIMLFSTRNGEPLAMINDGILQHMRVGGGAGLGVKYLSRPDSQTVGMLGSGGMARTYLEAFSVVRDIRSVKVFSPTKANRERYAEEMSAKLELEVTAVDTPEAAVEGVDIVAACTNAMEPALKGAWLERGQHATDVRGELDAEVFSRADVIVKQGVAHSRPSGRNGAEHGRRLQPGRLHRRDGGAEAAPPRPSARGASGRRRDRHDADLQRPRGRVGEAQLARRDHALTSTPATRACSSPPSAQPSTTRPRPRARAANSPLSGSSKTSATRGDAARSPEGMRTMHREGGHRAALL